MPRAHSCATALELGFDDLDDAVIATIDPVVRGDTSNMRRAVVALTAEPSNGLAVRNLLAKEIEMSRARLRFVEVAANSALLSFVRGSGDYKRVEATERCVERASKRLHSAISLMTRFDERPAVRINAVAAQVQIEATR